MKEESRINVIHALWNYIKINGLQDKVDRRTVRTNDELRAVSSPENRIPFCGADNDFCSFLVPRPCISRNCPRL